MKLLEFIQTGGPYGDATSAYKVKVHKENVTVNDIINYIISEKEDWGYIFIDKFFSTKRIEYSYGVIKSDNISNDDKNKIVKDITASGGWSRMDYNITIK